MTLLLSAVCGFVVGGVLWRYVGRRSESANWYGRFPMFTGFAIGIGSGVASALLIHDPTYAIATTPVIVAAAVMALTDWVSFRVYDPISLGALAYAVALGIAEGRALETIAAAVILATLATVWALISSFGTADIYGASLLGAIGGWHAYWLVLATFAVAMLLLAGRRFRVDATVAMFPGVFISVLAWYAGAFAPLVKLFA